MDQPHRILIVEDDPISRLALKTMLTKWGYEVISANDGHEGWKKYVETGPRFVITDWMMKGMDGRELCCRVRESVGGAGAYIVMITSLNRKEDLISGLQSGADDFLVKPFDNRELKARIATGMRILELQRRLEATIDELTATNDHMVQNLTEAADVQCRCIPLKSPQIEGIRFKWIFEPSDHLGGDMFNLFQFDDSHLGFYILDVSGHGVGASLLAIALNRLLIPFHGSSLLLEESGKRIRRPDRVIEILNQQFQMGSEFGKFFSMIYGILNTKTWVLSMAHAGHPEPLVSSARNDQVRVLSIDGGTPVGLFPEGIYRTEEVQLKPGDRLLFYTDGMTDALNPMDEPFSEKRLADAFGNQRHSTLECAVQGTRDALGSWCGERKPSDDLTMFAFEIEAEWPSQKA